MYAKLMSVGEMRSKLRPKYICAQLWNAIVINLVLFCRLILSSRNI
jgi:hypothetical protein